MKNKITLVVLIIIFIILGIISTKGYLISIDNLIYNIVNKMKCDLFTNLFKYISFMFSTIMVIFYCFLSILIYKNKRKSIFLCSIMACEAIINNVIKIIFKRPRPNVLALVIEKSYSFPSGHTMAVTVFILVLGYFIEQKHPNKKVIFKCIEFLSIILVAISRIYLGVHYFTDIVGAIILSIIILLVVKENKKVSVWLKEGNI